MSLRGSKEVARSALIMALSENREKEKEYKEHLAKQGYKTAAVDFGGDFISSVNKIIERTIVAAKREEIIKGIHAEEGAVAGATREALSQVMPKAIGLNVGGKIGIARYRDHISIAIFFEVGLLHLDDVIVGIGHRAVLTEEKE